MSRGQEHEKQPLVGQTDVVRSDGSVNGSNTDAAKGNMKSVFGALIVIGVAISWVGSTQASESAYASKASGFKAPFFSMWLSTMWFSVAFPIVMLVKKCMGSPVEQTFCAAAREILNGVDTPSSRKAKQQIDPVSLGVTSSCLMLAKTALPFLILWSGANYSYSRALMTTSASDVTAVFSATPALVYVLSLLFLNDKFHFVPLLAVLLTVAGVVLVALSEKVKGLNPIGVVLTLVAAVCAACYKVYLKRRIGDGSATGIALLLTVISFLNVILLWPIWVILDRYTDESFEWNTVPWNWLVISSVLGLAFNFLINFGIAFTYPLFISLGTVLGIPLNLIIDHYMRDSTVNADNISGCVLIIVGFVLLATPVQKLI